MSASRRYEILLPLRLNNGQAVPEELLGKVLSHLEQKFEAVSWETQIIRGAWQQAGTSYRDDLMRGFVDVPDTLENRDFFRSLKETLKADFQQLDIWLTSYSIDVL
jgi:hypothetical protein